MKFWQCLSFAAFLLGWLERSSRDGVITTTELIELVQAAAQHFQLDIAIEVPPPGGVTMRPPGSGTPVA